MPAAFCARCAAEQPAVAAREVGVGAEPAAVGDFGDRGLGIAQPRACDIQPELHVVAARRAVEFGGEQAFELAFGQAGVPGEFREREGLLESKEGEMIESIIDTIVDSIIDSINPKYY